MLGSCGKLNSVKNSMNLALGCSAATLSLALVLSGQDTTPKPAATKPKPAPVKTAPAKAAPAKAAPEAAVAKSAEPAKPGELTDSSVIITVGTDKITKGQFERFIANLPPQVQQQLQQLPKRRVAEDLASLKAFSQEARRRKIDQQDAVKQQIDVQVDNVLVGALYADIEKNTKTGDADLEAYFNTHKGEFEQLKARHILIRYKGSAVPLKKDQKDLSKEEALAKAQEIKKQLAAGADFAELAKKESDDSGSGAQGGDLGSFGKGMMVPAFETAAFGLAENQISDPVETQFGYHIIQAQEFTGRTWQSVREKIEAKVKPEAARKAMEAIKSGAKVDLSEAYFGAPAPAPAPAKP